MVTSFVKPCILVLNLACVAAQCVPSETKFCMSLDVEAGEFGLFAIGGYIAPSPDLVVQIGTTYTFDQTDSTNWFHPVGFTYFPDGAHGETWGGAERAEVEEAGELLYKIDGARTTCPDAGDTGLDCYEPEFFYPRDWWGSKSYTAELTITQAMADLSQGGTIFYFCHIHHRMSGRIIIQNADGSPATQADGSALANPSTVPLYPPPTRSNADIECGTTGVEAYMPGGAMECDQNFLLGTLDTSFETCMQAINCKMNMEMRVMGHDSHQDAITTFVQQMIPHHANAVNMAKILLKFDPDGVAGVEDLGNILWGIINSQNYDIHLFRNYLAGHAAYNSLLHSGSNLDATSVGEHCDSVLSNPVDLMITPTVSDPSLSPSVAGCDSSASNFCVKVNLHSGETGHYEFAGLVGPLPDITVRIGITYTFDQRDDSNWFHPIGFAYFPDGAHGDTWGGDERAEVEGIGELLYKIDGAATTCPDAGDTGLDCYEPEFFYPRQQWLSKSYRAELTITQAMADVSHGGILYYFCHIHSKMSGRIIIQNADGSPVTQADGSALANPTPPTLYAPTERSGVDVTCGTSVVEQYSGGGSRECTERYLCGSLDSVFEKCMQAIDCKMNHDMRRDTWSDHTDKIAIFMQQMIPHHENAVNMAKIVLKHVAATDIAAAMEENTMMDILMRAVNIQNFQIHQFRNYLGPLDGLPLPEAQSQGVPDIGGAEAAGDSSCAIVSRPYWRVSALLSVGVLVRVRC